MAKCKLCKKREAEYYVVDGISESDICEFCYESGGYEDDIEY